MSCHIWCHLETPSTEIKRIVLLLFISQLILTDAEKAISKNTRQKGPNKRDLVIFKPVLGCPFLI